MCRQLALATLFVATMGGTVPAFAQSVDLLAEYRFDPDLQPLIPGSTLTAFGTTEDANRRCNTTVTQPPLSGSWQWASSCLKGGGFIIDVDTDISSGYSVGVRFQFNQTTPGYRKIIDFKNGASDNGFYFQDGKVLFYPTTSVRGSTTYQANTVYDLVVTRDAATKNFTVYIVDGNSVNQEFSINDTNNDALPFVTIDGKTRLGFFFDDQLPASSGETTNGGIVYNVKIWRNALQSGQILDALSNKSPVITSNGGGATAQVTISEGATAITTVTATDADFDAISYRLSGGVDDALFTVDSSTGALAFRAAPDYDSPQDDNADNSYETTVVADDGRGGTTQQLLIVRVISNGPGGIGGHRLWLDADDRSTLFGDAACTQAVTVSGHDVACWVDKSASGSTVTDVGPDNGEPTWLENQFNGKPAMQFSKAEADTLRHTLSTPFTGEYTEFIVYQQQGTPQDYDAFFSNGPGAVPIFHQIDYRSGNFEWWNNNSITFEPQSNELKLYTVRGRAADTQTFADGALKNTAARTDGRNFFQYRINQNRSGSNFTNSKIAEVIIYDRALSDCEIADVNFYLGTKYGRDFFGIGSAWSHSSPFDQDINGIAAITDACGPRVIDSAQSAIVTINNALDLESGEKLLIGNNGAGLQTEPVDLPFGFDARLLQLWQFDANEVGDGVTVDISFDVSSTGGASGNSIDLSDPDQLVLLIGDDPANMATADLSPIGAVISGTTVTFPAVPLDMMSDGRYFTLAHQLPPGLFVHNAGPKEYALAGSPVVIAPDLQLSFMDPTTQIDQAKVNISENFQDGADVLSFVGRMASNQVPGTPLTFSFDGDIGVLTFSGTATAQVYQDVLRTVTFGTISPVAAQRKITFSIGSGLQFPGTGHFYEFIPNAGIDWNAARAAADTRSYFGLQGYLTTVTSQAESTFILNKLKGKQGWIGASDALNDTQWRWVSGPEGLEDSGNGRVFSQGASPVGGAFVNWQSGQPDNSGDAAYFIGTTSWAGSVPSKWDDVPFDYSQYMQGYVIEYGGMPNDPQLHLADDAIVNVLLPELTLVKVANTDQIVNREIQGYQLRYENTGKADALGVRITDKIPSGAEFVQADLAGQPVTPVGDTITWNIGTVPAGGSGAVGLELRMPKTLGTFTNTADISASFIGSVQAINSVQVVGPEVTINKVGPSSVVAGEDITYTITVENNGTSDAIGALVTDIFPAGTTFVSASPAPVSGGDPATDGFIQWDLGSFAPSASETLSLTLTAEAPLANTTINNRAQVTYTNGPIPQPRSVVSTYVTSCDQANQACLDKGFNPTTISKDTDVAALTFTLSNGTDLADREISFNDQLPAGLVLANTPATPQCGASIGTTASFDTVQVDRATLGPTVGREVCTITVNVKGTTAGAKTNNAGNFQLPTNVDVSKASAAVVVTEPVLDLAMTAPGSVRVNNLVTYRMTLSNPGNEDAEGVALRFTIPSGGTFNAASPGFGFLSNDVVAWNIQTLAAGASNTYTLTLQAPSVPATLTGTAVANSSNAATANANASVAVTGEPQFTLNLNDSPDPVDDGSDLTYTLNITNTGTIPAVNGLARMDLPANTSYVDAPGAVLSGGRTVTWNLGDLAVGASTSVSLTVNVDTPLADGTVIDASASAEADNLPVPVSATAQTTVNSEPDLTVTLDANPAVVEAGKNLDYTITFANNGTDTAANSELVLTLPAGFTLSTVTGSNALVQGSTIRWPLGDLLAGQGGSFIVTGVTESGLPSGSTLVASANLSSSTDCDGTGQPCASAVLASTRINSAANLTLSIDTTANVSAGDYISYALDYGNDGNLDASTTFLKMILPPNTRFISADNGGACFDGQTPPGPCVDFSTGNHYIEWDLGTLALNSGGRVGATLLVKAPLSDGTPLVANASLESLAPAVPPAVPVPPKVAQATTNVTSTAVLSLDVTAPPLVSPGKQILYQFNFSNIGTDVASDVVLESRIPTNTTFATATGGGTLTGDTVRWTLGDLGSRLNGSVTLLVDVDSPLPDGTVLTNNASLASSNTPPLSIPTATRVISAPIPTLIKTAAPIGVVAAGSPVTYSLTYGNAGDEDMLNAVLVDHLPTGYTPDQVGGGGVFDAATGTITWSLGDVAAGTIGGTHSFTLTVPSGTPNGAQLVNTATFESDNSQPVASIQGVKVTSSPILELTVTAPPQVDAGSDISYTLEYRNSGNAPALSPSIDVTLPPETAYLSASGVHAHTSNQVIWPLPDLQPGGSGSVTVTARVDAPLRDGTSLFNVASVNAINATQTALVTLTVAHSEPVLNISKIAPNTVGAGQALSYVVFWSNTGTDQATNVVVSDTLPSNVTFTSAGQGGTYDAQNRTVSWNLGDVPAGTSNTLDLTVTVDDPITGGTVLTNSASIVSSQTPPQAGQVQTNVQSIPVYNVALSSSPVGVIEAGASATLTIEYGNSGTQNGSNVALTALLPAGVTSVTASAASVAPVIDSTSGTVTWPIGALPAGSIGSESVSFEVPLGTANGTFLSSTATLHGDDGPAASTNSLLVVDATALLGLTTTAVPTVATPGQDVTFTMAYRNTGNLAADGVVVKTTLPAAFSPVSPMNGGVLDPSTNTVTWNLASLPAMSSGQLQVMATIDTTSPPADGSSFTVTSSLASTPAPGEPVTPPIVGSANVRISAPVLSMTKIGSPRVPSAGESLTYTLAYQNSGSATATQVTAVDYLDPRLEFVSASNSGSFDPVSRTVTWQLPDLPAGTGVLLLLETRVADTLANGTVVFNSADVQALEARMAPSGASTSNSVSSAPALQIEKIGETNPVKIGESTEFRISIENVGNELASNVIITDALPPGTELVSASGKPQYDPDRHLLTWNVGDRLPGSPPLVVTVEIRLLFVESEVVNMATVSADNNPPLSTTAVVQVADIPSIPALGDLGKLMLLLALALAGGLAIRRMM